MITPFQSSLHSVRICDSTRGPTLDKTVLLSVLLSKSFLDLHKFVHSSVCSQDFQYIRTLRLLLLAGTNFSVLVVCCIWQVLILAFFF